MRLLPGRTPAAAVARTVRRNRRLSGGRGATAPALAAAAGARRRRCSTPRRSADAATRATTRLREATAHPGNDADPAERDRRIAVDARALRGLDTPPRAGGARRATELMAPSRRRGAHDDVALASTTGTRAKARWLSVLSSFSTPTARAGGGNVRMRGVERGGSGTRRPARRRHVHRGDVAGAVERLPRAGLAHAAEAPRNLAPARRSPREASRGSESCSECRRRVERAARGRRRVGPVSEASFAVGKPAIEQRRSAQRRGGGGGQPPHRGGPDDAAVAARARRSATLATRDAGREFAGSGDENERAQRARASGPGRRSGVAVGAAAPVRAAGPVARSRPGACFLRRRRARLRGAYGEIADEASPARRTSP